MRRRPRLLRTALRLSILVALVTGAAVVARQAGAAEPFPQQTIRLVVSFQSATTMDTVARMIADKLEAALGKPVIVDNRPGASGQIAEEIVAKAKPDGHTLLVSGLALVTLPSIDGATALDPLEAFEPVAWLTSQPVAIVVHPSLHVDSLGALIDEARRRPGALSFSTNGLGGPAHLAATMLFKRAQVDLVIVPYNGAGALRDLLSGEVPLTFMYLTGLGPYLREQRLTALAVTSGRRLAAFADVPTVAELGYPGFDVTAWFGVLAPAGTPRDTVERLSQEIDRVLRLPDVRDKLAAVGIVPVGGSPESFGANIKSELARWRPLVKDLGPPK
jgi:tripartite-type tricarboxylate transporter receptor subunit TctC